MPIIVPAILENTKESFLQKTFFVTKIPGVERIQVDFGDGQFIEKRLLEAGEMDPLSPAFIWEAHLMCKEPKDFLDHQICGFKVLIVHYEAFASTNNLKRTLDDIEAMGFKTGVAINPDTPVNALKDISADQYLIMSVVPGKQGQAFIPATLDKIKELRQLLPRAIIEVDGGVNEVNIKSIKDAGADLICVGSALVKSANMPETYEKLAHEISS
ncbi:MAG: ribulose-phosphate 3-epimerase [Candidatus Doudnabacteria bacterium]|nr:ribulose-phosphate 3-epimerase [Candidatus Doudnabacteria bacterium]